MNKLKKYESCRNLFGELSMEIIDRLESFFKEPSPKTWDDTHCIIIGRDGFSTFWQCVIAVDPTFPKTGKLNDDCTVTFERIPDLFTARRAVKYAQTL